MALITCRECGKSYSDKADACPSCGCPTSLQTQVSSQTREETRSTQDTATSLSTKNTVSSANNDKLKIGGIIAIGVGAMIALSSGLITGSEKESYRVGNTWQTDISRSDGEKRAANGFIAIGVALILGGGFSLARAYGLTAGNGGYPDTKNAKKSETTQKSINKDRLYMELMHIACQNSIFPGTPSQSSSTLSGDKYTLKTNTGEAICTFIKEDHPTNEDLVIWTICDPSEN